jgi:hypothetical protein
MRSLSFLAITIAALTSIACGGPAMDAGNVYVSEALEGIDGVADTAGPVRLVTVAVDVNDPGCTVDGVRFGRCTITRTATVDYNGPVNLCELETDSSTYAWECDVSDDDTATVERQQEMPWHCPTG